MHSKNHSNDRTNLNLGPPIPSSPPFPISKSTPPSSASHSNVLLLTPSIYSEISQKPYPQTYKPNHSPSLLDFPFPQTANGRTQEPVSAKSSLLKFDSSKLYKAMQSTTYSILEAKLSHKLKSFIFPPQADGGTQESVGGKVGQIFNTYINKTIKSNPFINLLAHFATNWNIGVKALLSNRKPTTTVTGPGTSSWLGCRGEQPLLSS